MSSSVPIRLIAEVKASSESCSMSWSLPILLVHLPLGNWRVASFVSVDRNLAYFLLKSHVTERGACEAETLE
jgi:hypothetical protein